MEYYQFILLQNNSIRNCFINKGNFYEKYSKYEKNSIIRTRKTVWHLQKKINNDHKMIKILKITLSLQILLRTYRYNKVP